MTPITIITARAKAMREMQKAAAPDIHMLQQEAQDAPGNKEMELEQVWRTPIRLDPGKVGSGALSSIHRRCHCHLTGWPSRLWALHLLARPITHVRLAFRRSTREEISLEEIRPKLGI